MNEAADAGSRAGAEARSRSASAHRIDHSAPQGGVHVTMRATADFPADLTSAGQARDFIGTVCRDWGVPGVLMEAEMVVTELVENAVRHSRSDCDVTVELDDGTLTIGVGDRGTDPPRLMHPRLDEPGGRGLLLVNTVSQDWGFHPTDTGKLVWVDLPVNGTDG